MEFVQTHLAEVLVVLGIALLTIEAAILGFSTFILFFLGISIFLSGILVWLGVVPETLNGILIANAILTPLSAALLWKPLRKMQNQTDDKKVTSDFDGLEIILKHDINDQGGDEYPYSGITWQLKSHQPLKANTRVKVVKAEVGEFWVEPL